MTTLRMVCSAGLSVGGIAVRIHRKDVSRSVWWMRSVRRLSANPDELEYVREKRYRSAGQEVAIFIIVVVIPVLHENAAMEG